MKKLILSLCLVLCVIGIKAQDYPKFGMDAELGYSFRLSDKYYDSYKIMLSPGYHFNQSIFAGLGIGYMKLNQENQYYNLVIPKHHFSTFPVYAHAKYTPDMNTNILPFISLKAGYCIFNKNYKYLLDEYPVEFKYKGGLFISPQVGMQFDFIKGLNLYFAVSYDCIGYKYEGHSNPEYSGTKEMIKETKYSSGLGLSIGIGF